MEEKELDLLLGNKEKILTTHLFGIKKDWYLGKMTLYRMVNLIRQYAELNQDDEAIKSGDEERAISAIYQSILDNTEICAEVLSIAVKSWIPRWMLKWHFMRNVDSTELSSIVKTILVELHLVNFSIAISGMKMMKKTRPTEIAEK